MTEIAEIPGRGHALTIDSGWREVADTALAFVRRFVFIGMATGPATITAEERPLLAAARAGDEDAFRRLVEPYRGELHAHCYRMLGSVHDAEDALQDALLRAWRGLARFEGRSSLRSWLYTIATNTSLNLIGAAAQARAADRLRPRRRPARRARASRSSSRSGWSPTPTTRSASRTAWPAPRPATSSARASSWPSSPRCSTCRPTSAPCSSCARCSASRPRRPPRRSTRPSRRPTARCSAPARPSRSACPSSSQQATLRALGDERLNEIVEAYMKAWESCDVDAVVGMLTEDACFSMPPLGTWFGPRDAIETFLAGWPMSGQWRWRRVRVRANGQEALAFYSWDEDEQAYMPFALNVLTFRGELDQRRHRLHRPHPARGRRPRDHRAHARAAHRSGQAAGGLRALRCARAPELTSAMNPARAPGR